MSRGQLRRMAELARDEGITVRWQEARGESGAPLKALRALSGLVRRADHIVIGDPFSRYVQLLLTLVRAERLTVVDDGTATMEFVTQLARGERLTRWHRKGRGGPRELLLAPVTATARRRFTPTARHTVEVFTAMPVEPPRASPSPPTPSPGPAPASARRASAGGGPGRHVPGRDGGRRPGPVPGSGHGPGPRPRRDPLLRPPQGVRREAPRPGSRHRPGDRPPGPPPRTHRPPRPHRPHGGELPLDGGPHPPAGPGRHGRERRGLRHRPGMAPHDGLPARPGVPQRGHGDGPGVQRLTSVTI